MSDKSSARVIIETLAGTDKPTREQISTHYPMTQRIEAALIAEGHLPADLCGDCAVAPGLPHEPGCDVARCKLCGWQDIGDHNGCSEDEDRPSTIWTGVWPGKVEVEEYGIKDLNELASMCAQGLLKWDSGAERWVKPPTEVPETSCVNPMTAGASPSRNDLGLVIVL